MSCVSIASTALREHRARQRVERMKAGPKWQEQSVVFTTQRGTLLDGRNVSRWLATIRESAEDVLEFTFHDTRRTCASLLLALTVHPRVVMEILGHTQIGLTMETYTQVVSDLVTDAVGRLDTALGRE
jgi:integrase